MVKFDFFYYYKYTREENMKITIEDAAREYINKKGGHARILIQSCYSGGG